MLAVLAAFAACLGAAAAPAQGQALARAGASAGPGTLALDLVWQAPATTLDERVLRTRRAALEQGVWSLDPAARALMEDPGEGDALSRAIAATRLAPDLPAIRMEHARALWLTGDSPVEALRTAISAFQSVPRHVEASLWFGGNMLWIAAIGLAGGGLFFIGLTAVFCARRAAHVLGDLFTRGLPGFARAALLAGILLLPWVFGEGLLGFGVALLAIGVTYGTVAQRIALMVAAAFIWAGAYPVARMAGATLEAFHLDPVAEAAYAAAGGLVLAQDRMQLENAATDDLLATRALARHARREGNLGHADARYRVLLEALPGDPVIANNAANVRLALGHMGAAMELYQQAVDGGGAAIVLFNRAQAHGLAFQVDELGAALSQAQAQDPHTIAHLSELQRQDPTAMVVDLPMPPELMWRRVLEAPGGAAIAHELRAPVAPGRLGGDASLAGMVLGGVAVSCAALGFAVRPRRACVRCRRLLCPRCHPDASGRDVCEGCYHLFYKAESSEKNLRIERIEALRGRDRRRNRVLWAARLIVPGAAGLLAGRPFRALVASILAVAAAASLWLRNGMVPDPLVAGAAGPLWFLTVSAAAGLAYTVLTATSLGGRGRA
jgi:tetratricopeptide (TPR) repeat protein